MQIGVETSRLVETRRVFVLDADEITRAVLQFMLQDENETHDLASLDAAYAKAAEGVPDLLLVGVALLDSVGPAALRARWPDVRILAVADPAHSEMANHLVNLGAHGVLLRPFTVENVRRRVDIQLGRIVPSLIQLQLT